MIKITGRTAHQLRALEVTGFRLENKTKTTADVTGYETMADLKVAVQTARAVVLQGVNDVAKEAILDWADLAGRTDDALLVSARRGLLTALASVDRYVTEQAQIEADKPDLKTTEKIVKQRKAKAEKKAARRETHGQECHCGCKGTTGGGKYLPGHDAKHKSALVKAALGGDSRAEAVLADKGWTRFLDKAREVAARPKADPRVKRAEREQSDQERAQEKLARLALLKEAGEVLKGLGRYGKSSGECRVPVTRENAQAIIDGRFDFDAWDAADTWSDWTEFVKAEA